MAKSSFRTGPKEVRTILTPPGPRLGLGRETQFPLKPTGPLQQLAHVDRWMMIQWLRVGVTGKKNSASTAAPVKTLATFPPSPLCLSPAAMKASERRWRWVPAQRRKRSTPVSTFHRSRVQPLASARLCRAGLAPEDDKRARRHGHRLVWRTARPLESRPELARGH